MKIKTNIILLLTLGMLLPFCCCSDIEASLVSDNRKDHSCCQSEQKDKQQTDNPHECQCEHNSFLSQEANEYFAKLFPSIAKHQLTAYVNTFLLEDCKKSDIPFYKVTSSPPIYKLCSNFRI